MAERPQRRTPKAQGAQVLRTEQITPHMVRVVLGGEGLADFALGEYTDHYIKLCFAPEGADYSHPFDMAADPRGVPARAVAHHPDVHRALLGPRRP